MIWGECPYGECPDAPYDCTHWMPEQIPPMSPPEPCEACWYWSGEMKVCDRCCEGHAEKQWYAKVYGVNWQCKQLIHKGGKP